MTFSSVVLAFCLLIAIVAAPARAADGAEIFKLKCGACHAVQRDVASPVGPSLFGVAGRRAGTVKNFAYSPAFKGSRITWTDDALDEFLRSPATFAPGTRMAFGGINDAGQRRAIIDYLRTLH